MQRTAMIEQRASTEPWGWPALCLEDCGRLLWGGNIQAETWRMRKDQSCKGSRRSDPSRRSESWISCHRQWSENIFKLIWAHCFRDWKAIPFLHLIALLLGDGALSINLSALLVTVLYHLLNLWLKRALSEVWRDCSFLSPNPNNGWQSSSAHRLQ